MVARCSALRPPFHLLYIIVGLALEGNIDETAEEGQRYATWPVIPLNFLREKFETVFRKMCIFFVFLFFFSQQLERVV